MERDAAAEMAYLDQVEADLSAVEHALSRLQDGTYGTCEACGGVIPDARLAADPAARLCGLDASSEGVGGPGRP